jgi:hypothetical protein
MACGVPWFPRHSLPNQVLDETAVSQDDNKKLRPRLHASPSAIARTGWARCARYGLAFGLAALVVLLGSFVRPALSLAIAPSFQATPIPPSPTPVQVTPPPSAAAPASPGVPVSATWLLTFAGGLVLWIAGSLVVLAVLAFSILAMRRGRRRRRRVPPAIASVPYLDSPNGALYFRLERLDGNGLVIGRGKHGVDLTIDDVIPGADTVSNRHARIYYDASCGYVIVEDLGSTNGVLINGRQAPRKNLLRDGWVIGLGNLALTYHDGESDTGPLDEV